MRKLTLTDLSIAVLIWALLIAKLGYTYGTNDHIEILSYVLFLKDTTLFPHDLFIQSLHASQPNERTVFAHMLLPFTSHLAGSIFILHFLNTILLLLALYKLAERFIKQRYLSWLAVITSVVFMNDRGLGNVDLYTPSIQASDVSCMVIAWALNIFLENKYILAAILMSAATFIHVLEGFDVMAVMGAVMVWKYIQDKEVSLGQLLQFGGIYVLTAGVYLLFIFKAKTAGGDAMSQQELFWIMFEFRHPHHFIFRSFPMFNKLLFMGYTLAAVLFYPSRSKTVFQFVAVAVAGVVVYILFVDQFHTVFVANFQWYKVVQWVKYLGIVAVFGLVADRVNSLMPTDRKELNYAVVALGLIVIVFMGIEYSKGAFAHGYKQGNEAEISLCEKVRAMTPKDAVFIQPFEMTALKFYGQRSSYVEFKAIAKNQKDLKRWYERIQEVYGLDYLVDQNGFGMQQKANDALDGLSADKLHKLKEEGVTHLICKTDRYQQTCHLLLSENGYFVYQL